MSLLLDENLSPRLTFRLASLFRSLIHVRDVGLKQAGDEEIWNDPKSGLLILRPPSMKHVQ